MLSSNENKYGKKRYERSKIYMCFVQLCVNSITKHKPKSIYSNVKYLTVFERSAKKKLMDLSASPTGNLWFVSSAVFPKHSSPVSWEHLNTQNAPRYQS